ncbi:complex I subunit 5 family protein [Lujinxingia litoralis]|uniref:complex I subunit 5 family protein n=1 Tax=Lujinxingia litoralis TaxID=2211119 RepID=UPI0018F7234E|nr:proton-conducting transporter membrane subunit [Lujinxingia litoralis]
MNDLPLASLAVWVPLVGALITSLAPRHRTPWWGLAGALVSAMASLGLVVDVAREGPRQESLGGWGAPLGIELWVDGLAALMVAMCAVVGLAVSVYAVAYFKPDGPNGGHAEESQLRRQAYFWRLWLLVWAAMVAAFVSADLFNLYVAIEVLGLGAVSLVALAGGRALPAALRYLYVTLCGSLFYLSGVVLLYGDIGALDMATLGGRLAQGPTATAALTLMVVGLSLKTALFPLHFWLPQAHADAPAPVSALLSALVIKVTFYILIRLGVTVFAGVGAAQAGGVLLVLGVIAILWGSLRALLQTRLKMMVAYSTVAQVGYLFVVLGLAPRTEASVVWQAGAYFMIAHACAKGAMFLAAGAIARAVGHDQIGQMRGVGQGLALPFFAFGLGGISLMGLPPSGGFVAKWLFITGAVASGDVIVVIALAGGGLLAAAYVVKTLGLAFERAPREGAPSLRPISPLLGWSAMALAAVAVILGVAAGAPLALLEVGLPFGSSLAEGVSP